MEYSNGSGSQMFPYLYYIRVSEPPYFRSQRDLTVQFLPILHQTYLLLGAVRAYIYSSTHISNLHAFFFLFQIIFMHTILRRK